MESGKHGIPWKVEVVGQKPSTEVLVNQQDIAVTIQPADSIGVNGKGDKGDSVVRDFCQKSIGGDTGIGIEEGVVGAQRSQSQEPSGESLSLLSPCHPPSPEVGAQTDTHPAPPTCPACKSTALEPYGQSYRCTDCGRAVPALS